MVELLVALFQTVLVALAGVLLFVLWRRFAREGIAVRIVALGFAGRAILSATLFWVSWLSLPIGSSLQLGDGLWFYALDGRGYYRLVDEMLEQGFAGVSSGAWAHPALNYARALVLSKLAFGPAVSAALIINMFSFLGTAALVASWANRAGTRREGLVVLSFLSVYPSFALWSTQPLKDTLMLFVGVAFVHSVARWCDSIRQASMKGLVLSTTVLVLLTLFLRRLRWQYAVALWAAFAPVALVMLTRLRVVVRRRLAIVGAALGGVVALMVVWRAEPDLVQAIGSVAGRLVRYMESTRSNFVAMYDPSTLIEPGPVIASLPYADVLARGFMFALPRFVTEHLGLATGLGGRGLWWFAELDTTLVLLFAVWVLVVVWRRRSVALAREPMFVFLVLVFLAGLPTLYMVNNFGSLIRFRQMMIIPLLLLPLVVSGQPAGDAPRGLADAEGGNSAGRDAGVGS